jgi:peptide/nickel transport system ATP-binding protein
MTAFVQLKNVSKTFDVSAPWLNRVLERKPQTFLHAVSDVSFDINRGETLALVGESGCGKSTVARLIVGLYAASKGNVTIDGQDMKIALTSNDDAARALRRKVQMIFQDPYASLNPRWRVADIVAEPIRTHKLIPDGAALDKRVAELLGYVKLTAKDGEKFPHQFSGGQRQRISIARALASNPEFLICDEPTSALDVSVQAQVLNLMKDLQREMGLTYLFISHNLQVVHHIADRVGVMYLGRVVEIGDKREVFGAPQHPYTRMLLDAIPDLRMTGKARTPVAGEVPNPLNPPSGCAFNPRCPQKFGPCDQSRPQLVSFKGRQVACYAATGVAEAASAVSA